MRKNRSVIYTVADKDKRPFWRLIREQRFRFLNLIGGGAARDIPRPTPNPWQLSQIFGACRRSSIIAETPYPGSSLIHPSQYSPAAAGAPYRLRYGVRGVASRVSRKPHKIRRGNHFRRVYAGTSKTPFVRVPVLSNTTISVLARTSI